MSTDFAVYCIQNVSSPPQALSRRKESGEFYCHIAVPIPDMLVIFSEGQWEDCKDFDAVLRYKDDEIHLGHISKSNSCISWRRSGCIPDSMVRESEKGLAKLVLENRTPSPLLINMGTEHPTDKPVIAELTEDPLVIPSKPQKKKRSSSLGKDKMTCGPNTKKQRLQTTKPSTRVRKSDSPETQLNKISATKKGKSQDMPIENLQKTDENAKEKKGRKMSKEENIGINSKVKKDTKNNMKEEVKEKKSKKDKLDTSEETLKEKKAKKDNKTEGNIGDENQAEKKTRKGSKTEARENSESKTAKGDKEKERGNSPTTAGTDEPQPKKRGRKSKKDEIVAAVKDTDRCDKENVDSNLPNKPQQDSTQISQLKNSKMDTSQNTSNYKVDTSDGNGKKKMAFCKDLTSRALARPTGRWGHSLCFIHKNLSVLIGGQGEKQQLNKDSVWTLDTETRRWKNPTTQSEGQKPENRMGHTATYDPMVRCIYVFGGSKNTRWFHDVHVLDIDEWKWQLVKVNGKAPTRAYHSATLYRHELWIFGGVYPRPDPQPDGCSNDIHIFSPVMESWYSPIVRGEKPIQRSGHSATLLNDQLVMFGGWDAPISYSDLHILDMSIVEWSQPKFTGPPPSPRSWHASCALTGNRLLIHGGYNGDFALEDTHIFNLDNFTWSQIKVDSQPTARVGHRALCMPYRHDNEEEDEVIMFGGGDNDGEYFDDLMSFYVPFDPVEVTEI